MTPSPRTPAAKVALFRSRFVGRAELYARRWESRDGARAGYAPVCANEWRAGVCKKPTVPCHVCTHRAFEPVTDEAVRRHLRGEQVVGLYALDQASRTRFVVIDLDHACWRDDALALLRICSRLAVPALGEISRSGDGAHVWLFFDAPVAASAARDASPRR